MPGGEPLDLPALDQAAAAELDTLTANLRNLLAGLDGYEAAKPAAPHSLDLSSSEAVPEARQTVLDAFEKIAKPLRSVLRDIRGRDTSTPRQILDLPALQAAYAATGIIYIAGAAAAAPVLRLVTEAVVERLASLPVRELKPKGRLLERLPSFVVLDDFEDYPVPRLDVATLKARGVALTLGMASFADLKRDHRDFAQGLWASTDIHVLDRGALDDPEATSALRSDASFSTMGELPEFRELFRPEGAQLLMAFHDRRVIANQASSKTAVHLVAYTPAFVPPPAPRAAPAPRTSTGPGWLSVFRPREPAARWRHMMSPPDSAWPL